MYKVEGLHEFDRCRVGNSNPRFSFGKSASPSASRREHPVDLGVRKLRGLRAKANRTTSTRHRLDRLNPYDRGLP
jgi:hypothetical protein